MAEQPTEGLVLPQQDAGAAFRTEMALANFLYGYWRHILALVGAVLVGALVYGQYQSWYRSGQMKTTAEISDVRAKLPEALLSPYPAQGGLSDADKQAARDGAAALVKIGESARGAARAEAYLNAAELFRQAGDASQQRAALEAASASAKGALRYAAVAGLANLDLEEGRGEDAVSRLSVLANEVDGMLAEQATLDLGLAHEHLGQPEQALSVYDAFVQKWPESPRASEAASRKARLGAR